MSQSRAEHEDPRAPHGTSAPVDDGTTRCTRSKTVEWIDRIINDVENEVLQAEIRQEVKVFMADYPLYAEGEMVG